MERNIFMNNTSFKGHNNATNKKLKDLWSSSSQIYGGEDYFAGFSWPPRSYTCSFCKREFRSAQALGGHMNVHRRDRARLRSSLQSPPPPLSPPPSSTTEAEFINPNPNPSRNLLSSSPLITCTTLPSLVSFSSLSSPQLSFGSASTNHETKKLYESNLNTNNGFDSTKYGTRRTLFDTQELDGYGRKDGCKKLMKKSEFLTLDVEIDVVSDSKEDLDLELRLGYS